MKEIEEREIRAWDERVVDLLFDVRRGLPDGSNGVECDDQPLAQRRVGLKPTDPSCKFVLAQPLSGVVVWRFVDGRDDRTSVRLDALQRLRLRWSFGKCLVVERLNIVGSICKSKTISPKDWSARRHEGHQPRIGLAGIEVGNAYDRLFAKMVDTAAF